MEVYDAKPDGYTMLAESVASSSMLEAVSPNLPFKVMDRTFIGIGMQIPLVFIVPFESRIKNLKELEVEAKNAPGDFSWASLGGGGATDFAIRQFFKVIGVDFKKTKAVIGSSGGEITMLVAGGHVKVSANGVIPVYPAISGKTIRGVAITSKSRYPLLPDIPTTVEAGYPAVRQSQWVGISGPPQLPSSIGEIWDKAFQEINRDAEFKVKLEKIGGLPFYYDGPGTKKYVLEENAEVKELWGVK
jgi:tripartite-type tricarboxylate transporter receptor subunit TctC